MWYVTHYHDGVVLTHSNVLARIVFCNMSSSTSAPSTATLDLINAVNGDNYDAVVDAVTRGADIGFVPPPDSGVKGSNPLFTAIFYNQVRIIAYLVSQASHTQLNLLCQGATPLHQAIRIGSIWVTELLASRGAVDSDDGTRMTERQAGFAGFNGTGVAWARLNANVKSWADGHLEALLFALERGKRTFERQQQH
jgi:hypothetical protein